MGNLEIIERSLYSALLDKLVDLKYTLNPSNYYPPTTTTETQFEEDKKNLIKYIPIFGAGNAESKGLKTYPRIVIESHGFYQGNIGLPKIIEEKVDNGFQTIEIPYESLDQYMDIRLVSNNQSDNRLLHQLLFYSIPYRGYIKPYNQSKLLTTGNIFLEVVNFFDAPDVSDGIIEKVYQFKVSDFVMENNDNEPIPLPILNEVDLILDNGKDEKQITFKKE